MSKVTDETCFSRECWWISGRIRCRGCPYIDDHGIIINPKIAEISRRVEIEYTEAGRFALS